MSGEPELHIAMLCTRHFDFMAGGTSPEHARDTMRRAWAAHARETGAGDTWAALADDVNVVALRPGDAVRDGCLLVTAGGSADAQRG